MTDVSERKAHWILACLIVVSTIGFSYLAYLKYARFNWETPDTTLHSYAFFQALHGNFFPYYARHHGLLLGDHLDFLVLLWFPVFWVVRATYSLFLFQSLMISLAAWPVYLLARDKIGNRLTALIAAAGLLVFPPVVGQHVNQIRQDQFGLVFLLFALYYFEAGSFKKFTLFAGLSLLAKETIALNVAMFGFYALLRHRGWKWMVFPFVGGVAYLVLALKVMPLLGDWSGQAYGRPFYFSAYGNSLAEVLWYFVTNPAHTVEIIFSGDRLRYLVQFLWPLLLVLPFRSWSWTLALPNVGMNLLSSNYLLRDLTWHYNVIAGGLLWASFVLTLPRWSAALTSWFGGRDFNRCLCALTLLLSVAGCGVWLSPWQYKRAPSHGARVAAVRAVPLDATVLAPENMLAHFADHPALNSLLELRYYNRDINDLFDYDYIVFDANYASPDWRPQSQLFDFISKHPDYHSVFSHDNVFVFQRVGTPARILHW